ncbi:MAG: NUDIX hydrolase [Actinomycetota bacterium]
MAPTLAVGAIVVRDGALLMVQRGTDPGKDLWSIPGGRVEHGELLSDALKREVAEETGIAITVGSLAGILEVPGAETHYVILDYFATALDHTEPRAEGDAADARWVPLDDVVKLDCTPRFIEMMKAWGVL